MYNRRLSRNYVGNKNVKVVEKLQKCGFFSLNLIIMGQIKSKLHFFMVMYDVILVFYINLIGALAVIYFGLIRLRKRQ